MEKVRSAGFTLVELLVVIAIIGVLVALLMPAVQAARETSRKVSCTSNLKQMSLACLMYEQQYKQFMPGNWAGIWGDPDKGAAYPYGHFGWAAAMLPFVEAQNVYDRIDFSKSAYAPFIFESPSSCGDPSHQRPLPKDETNKLASLSMPSVFVCPSSRDGDGEMLPAEFSALRQKAFKDYAANAGLAATPALTPAGDGIPFNEGMLYCDSGVSLADVLDGTSNTMFFCELASTAPHGPIEPGYSGNQFFFVHHASQGYVSFSRLTQPRSAAFNVYHQLGALTAFSDHVGGMNVVFVDGHVQWLVESIDMKTYRGFFTKDFGTADSMWTW